MIHADKLNNVQEDCPQCSKADAAAMAKTSRQADRQPDSQSSSKSQSKIYAIGAHPPRPFLYFSASSLPLPRKRLLHKVHAALILPVPDSPPDLVAQRARSAD